MVAETSRRWQVFDVVGRPTSWGVTWAWIREDLDSDSVERARSQLCLLFLTDGCPHRLLVHLGADCFVDLRGLRLLLETATEVRSGGGALAVVAPPRSLVRMAALFVLAEELPMVDSVDHAVEWARARTGA